MGIFSSGQTRAANMALALRTIEGNLAFTDQAAWAWFALPTQRWVTSLPEQRPPNPPPGTPAPPS